jgi:hypothetical protein
MVGPRVGFLPFLYHSFALRHVLMLTLLRRDLAHGHGDAISIGENGVSPYGSGVVHVSHR